MENHIKKAFQMVRNNYGDEFYKSVLINHHLYNLLLSYDMKELALDLNPQLSIKHICQTIVEAVKTDGIGIECSENDVMVVWLINSIQDQYLYKIKKYE